MVGKVGQSNETQIKRLSLGKALYLMVVMKKFVHWEKETLAKYI